MGAVLGFMGHPLYLAQPLMESFTPFPLKVHSFLWIKWRLISFFLQVMTNIFWARLYVELCATCVREMRQGCCPWGVHGLLRERDTPKQPIMLLQDGGQREWRKKDHKSRGQERRGWWGQDLGHLVLMTEKRKVRTMGGGSDRRRVDSSLRTLSGIKEHDIILGQWRTTEGFYTEAWQGKFHILDFQV